MKTQENILTTRSDASLENTEESLSSAPSSEASERVVYKKSETQGILLVDKKVGSTSFRLVSLLRRLTKIRKIGHAGTLDPFATGVMVMLVGSAYTKRSDQFLGCDKQYLATFHLGITTDSYDVTGQITARSDRIPSHAEIEKAINASFQGKILQTPPMFSAKKIQGKKLYDLARQGISIPRSAAEVTVKIAILRYEYPELDLQIDSSKGTYIRSLAFDLGEILGTGAHVSKLTRTKSGAFTLDQCVPEHVLEDPSYTPNFIL